MLDNVLIFDGTNTFHRNFVVNPTMDSNGEPIGGLMGTIRSIKYMIAEVKPTKVIFVWDGIGGSQKRRGIIADYKMGRKPRLNRGIEEGAKDSKDNFAWQAAKLKQLLPFLGITQIEVDNIEADDTIGYLVGLLDPVFKVVVSSDRDMWQLVSDTTIVYWPTKKVFISKETFKEQTPILPENYVLVRAMSGKGDTSDNIHGIKGLGEKTILKLFPEFCSEEINLMKLVSLCNERAADSKGIKRWYSEVNANIELIKKNVGVMQLTSPIISAQSAIIIKNAAGNVPSFNMTGFKLALLNNSIQLTDPELFPVFQQYKARIVNASA